MFWILIVALGLAWIVQSANGAHFEYKAYNNPADRIVERRQWLTLRLDF